MEISPPKQLHKHALPVVILLLGLFIVSGVAWYGGSNFPTEQQLARNLVRRVIYGQQPNDGVAGFSIPEKTDKPSLSHAGQTAQTEFNKPQ